MKLFINQLSQLSGANFLQTGQQYRLAGNSYGVAQTPRKLSWLACCFVVVTHLTVVFVLHNNKPQTIVPETPPQPIMVSLLNEQPPSNPISKTVSVPKPTPKNPVTAKPKQHQSKKPVNKVPAKPVNRPVVKQLLTNESLSSEKSSTSSDKSETTPAPASPAPNKMKASNTETKYQAPSFNAGYLHNPPPKYPAMSRRMSEQGKVLLKVMVSADGGALSVALYASSGFSRLDEAAIAAVEKWRFVPASRSGQKVSASVVVPIKFSLGG